MVGSDLVKAILEVDDAIRTHSQQYFHTTGLCSVKDKRTGMNIHYDLRDMFLIGALANADVLIVGTTGTGKSHLAKMVMTALFGTDGYANLTVTPDLSPGDFLDIDICAIKAGEKTPKEALHSTPLLSLPGSIINEINRTHGVLQNIFIGILENDFSFKGVEFPVGVPLIDGKNKPSDPHYQFRIISMNEGAGYEGTTAMDYAVRDRATIEIPIDIFAPRRHDHRRMLQQRNNADLRIVSDKSNDGMLDHILLGLPLLETVSYQQSAEEFLGYLLGMNNCINMKHFTKRDGNFRSIDVCKGCHHTRDPNAQYGNVCGNVYAPSDRSLISLKKLGQAVAAVRAYKVFDYISRGELAIKNPQKFMNDYLDNVSVTIDDVVAVAPFVLASKTEMNPKWVGQYFQGSKYLAIAYILDVAQQKFKQLVGSNVYTELIKTNGSVTPEIQKRLETYARETDAFAYDLRESNQGLQFSRPNRRIDVNELL